MSGTDWVERSKEFLETMKKLELSSSKDRLDLVRSIIFSLRAAQHAITGWLQWAYVPEIMSKFTVEELKEMDGVLREQARALVEYDIKTILKNPSLSKLRDETRPIRYV